MPAQPIQVLEEDIQDTKDDFEYIMREIRDIRARLNRIEGSLAERRGEFRAVCWFLKLLFATALIWFSIVAFLGSTH
jgi:hypothetical protein